MLQTISLEEGIVELLRQGAKDLDQIFMHLKCNGCPGLTSDRLKKVLENLGENERTYFCGGVYQAK